MIPHMMPPMPPVTATACQMLSPVPSGRRGVGWGTRPEMEAASVDACSSVMPEYPGADAMFTETTPLSVFMYPSRDAGNNPHRKKLWLTSSNYADALNIYGAYSSSRYAFTLEKYYHAKPPAPPNEFLNGLLEHGRRTEPIALRRWRNLYSSRYTLTGSGLLLDTCHPDLFGATPDGLVFDTASSRLLGVLEVKCPRDRSLAVTPDRVKGSYLYQILGQLMCLKDCYRFWYFEYKSDTEFVAWEGVVTEELKQECRHRLMQYKDLVTYNTAESFPKRATKFSVDPASFRLVRSH